MNAAGAENGIYLVRDGQGRERSRAISESAYSIEVDLHGARGGRQDTDDLITRLAAAFRFPMPAGQPRYGGLDGALDWMSDLEWIGSETGYVAVVLGIDDFFESDASLASTFIGVLHGVMGRWSDQPTPFSLVIECGPDVVGMVRSILDERDQAALRASQSFAWVTYHQVRVIDLVDVA